VRNELGIIAVILLVAGCATHRPRLAIPPSPLDDADQRTYAGKWGDYVCSLPPQDRQAAVAKANGAYVVLAPNDPPPDLSSMAGKIVITCPL
jgi:hypothetical protein